MSKVTTTTLQDLASGKFVPVLTVQRGAAKSWFNVNQGGTQAVRDSLNVSSIVDGGVGLTQANFSSVMANNNFMNLVTTSSTSSMWGAAKTTSSYGVFNYASTTAAAADASEAYSAAYGDLA